MADRTFKRPGDLQAYYDFLLEKQESILDDMRNVYRRGSPQRTQLYEQLKRNRQALNNLDATYDQLKAGSFRDLASDPSFSPYKLDLDGLPNNRNAIGNLLDDPVAGWNNFKTGARDFSMNMAGLDPAAGRFANVGNAVKSYGSLNPQTLTGLGNWAGIGLNALGTWQEGAAQGQEWDDTIAETVGSGLGTWGGTTAGAAIGTLIAPGPGTIIGGIIGSLGGGKAGKALFDWGWDFIDQDTDDGIETPESLRQRMMDELSEEYEFGLKNQQKYWGAERAELEKRALFEEALAQRAAEQRLKDEMQQLAFTGFLEQNMQNQQIASNDFANSLSSMNSIARSQNQLLADLYRY